MNILIAPDKFKGTLSAAEVCDGIEAGLKQSGLPLTIRKFPLADGGEGTLDIFLWHTGGQLVEVDAHDPLMRKIKARYGLSGDGKVAIIEMAEASGLGLLTLHERNPMKTTTFGTGELMAHALERDVEELVLGIGGTATNEAALGAAVALGAQFFDRHHNPVFPRGETLGSIAQLDLSKIHPRLRHVRLTAMCDVINPFYGENGAAHVYAPQKGATPEDVLELDHGLKELNAVIRQQTGIDLQQVKGSGAGGGFAGGAYALFGAALQPGIEVVFDLTHFEEALHWADVVITGEGKFDQQSLQGKVVDGVARLAHRLNKEVIVICGQTDLQEEEWRSRDIRAVYSLTTIAGTKRAMHQPASALEEWVSTIAHTFNKQKKGDH
jgi:glycerate 2-kinase